MDIRQVSLREWFDTMVSASSLLAKNPTSPLAASSLSLLRHVFCDVALNEPLPLSTAESYAVTQTAATEMRDVFKAARKRYRRTPPDSQQVVDLFTAAVPLWRELAAANWVVVKAFMVEAEAIAEVELVELMADMVAQGILPQDESDTAAHAMALCAPLLEDPDSHLSQVFTAYFVPRGIGRSTWMPAVHRLAAQ